MICSKYVESSFIISISSIVSFGFICSAFNSILSFISGLSLYRIFLITFDMLSINALGLPAFVILCLTAQIINKLYFSTPGL